MNEDSVLQAVCASFFSELLQELSDFEVSPVPKATVVVPELNSSLEVSLVETGENVDDLPEDNPLFEMFSVSSGVNSTTQSWTKSNQSGSHEVSPLRELGEAKGKRVFLKQSKYLVGTGTDSSVYKAWLYCDPFDENGPYDENNFYFAVAFKKVYSIQGLQRNLVFLSQNENPLLTPTLLYFFTGHPLKVTSVESEIPKLGLYMLLEYSPYRSLSRYMAVKGSFSEEETRLILRDVLDGLQFLHDTEQLVHNDIKPQNVIVFDRRESFQFYDIDDDTEEQTTRDLKNKPVDRFRFKLTDFGAVSVRVPTDDLRRQLENSTEKEDEQLVGTFHYMSPEACLGCSGVSSNDVWAVGVMAYQLATGSSPWSLVEQTFPTVIYASYRRKYSDPLQLLSDTPPSDPFGPYLDTVEQSPQIGPALKDFILGCLTENPLKRPSCSELLRHPFLCHS